MRQVEKNETFTNVDNRLRADDGVEIFQVRKFVRKAAARDRPWI